MRLLLPLLLLFAFGLFAQDDKIYNIYDHQPSGKVLDDETVLTGPNLKLMPAVFASTLGVELEIPIKKASSFGVNILGKYGRFDNPRIQKPVDYFDTGYRIELAYKYYFAKKGPLGVYAQVFVGYSKLLYDNGNTRPFALNLRNLDLNSDPRTDNSFDLPKPYTGGLGIGYQTKLYKDKIIGNLMLGSQVGFDAQNVIFYSVYLSPSIGYVF